MASAGIGFMRDLGDARSAIERANIGTGAGSRKTARASIDAARDGREFRAILPALVRMPTLARPVALLALVVALAPLAQGAAAQQPDSSAVPATLETFARAYRAMALLRDRTQAELAAPANKKREVQAELRDKARAARTQLLRANGLSEGAYAEWVHRVSVDDTLRARFDSALARLERTPPG